VKADEKGLRNSLLYSEELGIRLKQNRDAELFKWFLASILFGARISETIAKKTYKAFERYRLLAPRRILNVGWDFLVNPIMREGGYVRYDGKTSTRILRNCETLLQDYDGSLLTLHKKAHNNEDLERMLTDFYGIGPVTANIFLRELRPYWKKSNPEPLPNVCRIAQNCGINLDRYDRKTITFTRIEAGLLRLRREISKTPQPPKT
jgi:hypothetical protein